MLSIVAFDAADTLWHNETHYLQAVYIPYQHTWAQERVVGSEIPERAYYELEHLAQLPGLIAELHRQ
jgi:hypothetical protein